MVVIIKKYGQTCNRLFQYAHLYAFCRSNHIKLLNPSFHDLSKYFENSSRENTASFLTKVKYFLRSVFCLLTGKFINIDSEEKGSRAKDLFKKSDYLTAGWCFRDNTNFKKYAVEIRDVFKINSELVKVADLEFSDKRKEYDAVIGVHIRRGDYKVWEDGKYYYNDDEYISIIKQISTLLGNKLLFVVCSNEEIDQMKYKAIENEKIAIWIPHKNFINELYLLSKCDRIIGPPSTFSLWASFSGNTPYLHITDKSFSINMQDFKVCEG